MRQQLIEIIKQAKGKLFTYLNLETANNLSIQTCINELRIDSIGEDAIYIDGGKKGEWAEIASIGLDGIIDIEEREKDEFQLEDAEAEYIIKYDDGVILEIQILAE